jgi:hypothetical protein
MAQTFTPGFGCADPLVVSVPGAPGTNGTNGAAGPNPFSIVQKDFTVPELAGPVSVIVDDNSWMVVGQAVFVFSAGYFTVNSLASTTVVGLTYTNQSGNTAARQPVSAAAKISPAGTQAPFPYSDATPANVTGLSQALTDTATLVAGATVTVPAAGLYLVLASATLELDGVATSADRQITLQVQNTTAAATVATCEKDTGLWDQYSLAQGQSHQYGTPYLTATFALNDVIELQASVSVLPESGTINVTDASLCIVPLRPT